MIYWQWGTIQIAEFQEELQESTIEVTPDAGIPFKRQRFTDTQEIINATFTLSKSEYVDFISFYKFNIQQGALSFQYFDTRVNAYRTTRIVGKPSIVTNSNMYDVKIVITFEDGGT